jgi:hypothetical protein
MVEDRGKGRETCVQVYSRTVDEAPGWPMRSARLVEPGRISSRGIYIIYNNIYIIYIQYKSYFMRSVI